MMVPRSYSVLHQSSPPSSPRTPSPSSQRPISERMGLRTRMASSPASLTPVVPTREKRDVSPAITVREPKSSVPAPSQTKPVVIPPRAPSRRGPTSAPRTIRPRGVSASKSQDLPVNHKQNALSPAVAALLAVTEIPKMPPRRRKRPTSDRHISMDELIQEWKQEEPELPASVVGSPLDLLLGRVEESEDEFGSLLSVEHERNSYAASSITPRSVSSDSLLTVPPSLTDEPSDVSEWDSLSTPESYTHRPVERRERAVSSPPAQDCALDHPLLKYGSEDCESGAGSDIPNIVTSDPPSTERFKSFKSNLTASLQALKSAAKSFSNFTAPSVPPDDLLTRALFTSRFTSEMRPKQVQGVPSPALRRYLNPQPTPISVSDLSMQLHEALTIGTDEVAPIAPMIQMQTYERRSRASSRRRKGSESFTEAGRVLEASPAVRQREPRENGDFLRMIVLEMNMRRSGKLDTKAQGRARIWLPPRKWEGARPENERGDGGVPTRWVAVSVT